MSNEKKNDGGPAFACAAANEYANHIEPGMSLRDYFAARAMERFMDEWREGVRLGRYTERLSGELDEDSVHHIIANDSYAMADAMLIARERDE